MGKIFVEQILNVFDNNRNIFRKPAKNEAHYRVVIQDEHGFRVMSTHITKAAALRRVKSLRKRKS